MPLTNVHFCCLLLGFLVFLFLTPLTIPTHKWALLCQLGRRKASTCFPWNTQKPAACFQITGHVNALREEHQKLSSAFMMLQTPSPGYCTDHLYWSTGEANASSPTKWLQHRLFCTLYCHATWASHNRPPSDLLLSTDYQVLVQEMGLIVAPEMWITSNL